MEKEVPERERERDIRKDNWNLEEMTKPGSVELPGTYEIDFTDDSSNEG